MVMGAICSIRYCNGGKNFVVKGFALMLVEMETKGSLLADKIMSTSCNASSRYLLHKNRRKTE